MLTVNISLKFNKNTEFVAIEKIRLLKIYHFLCSGIYCSPLSFMICNISNVQKVFRNNCEESGCFDIPGILST